MNKRVKYKMKKMIRITGLLFLIPFICLSQRVYHVDPNEVRPSDSRSMISKNEMIDADKIIIRNNYSSAVTVMVSMDNKVWDTVQIKEKNFISSRQKAMYMKIYTSQTNYKVYQLAAGTQYQLFWNKDEKLWQIVK